MGAEPRMLHSVDQPPDVSRLMWHITVTVAGAPVEGPVIKAALERLSEEHPFLLSGRYSTDRAEVRYWEEAPDVATALRMASRATPPSSARSSGCSRTTSSAASGHAAPSSGAGWTS